MPKLSSSTSSAATATKKTAVEPTVEVVAPVKSQKVKAETKKAAAPATPVAASEPSTPKKKSTKTAASAVAATTPAVVAVSTEPATAGAASTETAAVSQSSSDYSTFMTKLQLVSTMLSSLRGDFRSLEKKNSRDLKLANKANAKRARKQKGNRSPSGFVKPTLISVELATFLGKESGTQMARTEVTREINTYIRANSLQDKENGRKINADEKLASLLKLNKDEELTYFNLQRYMSPHFVKTTAAVVVA